jgi:radial spoke head protein 4A
MKQLAETQPLKSVTFWGKIYGMEKNYIIAEAQYREGEEPQPEEEVAEAEEEEGEGEEEVDPLPKSTFKANPPLPNEEYGAGVNKKVYYVCNEPGQEWVLLPNTTPKAIDVARQIRKRFTGNLDTEVISHPQFPGTEALLLRAQIARITAGTHVSPSGFYTFAEDDEEDEDERDDFIEDEEFEGKTLVELQEPDLSGWVHHAQFILPQGRCKWVNPSAKDEADLDEDDEDEEEEEDEVEPETGPPLLTPLQNDTEVDGMPAWSTRLSSNAHPAFSCVRISSNRWPGAHAFGVGKQFANVYIGFGLKYSPEPFSPTQLPPIATEYNGEDITETIDPTREEEEEFEAAQAAQEADDDDEEED